MNDSYADGGTSHCQQISAHRGPSLSVRHSLSLSLSLSVFVLLGFKITYTN